MASSIYENLVGLNPQMSVINPGTGMAYDVLPAYQITTDDPFKNVSGFRDTSKGTIDSTADVGTNGTQQPNYTAKEVVHYASAVADVMKGGAAIANGYIAKMSAGAKASAYRFRAEQNRRASALLLANQVDVTRAAQMDSNKYRIAGKKTTAGQKVAMASSGFTVGKGSYANTLNTTEAIVNYNVANLMLKADLENAELTRKAGAQMAEAIINEANAEIAKKEGRAAVRNGWISGIANFISAGAAFYCGRIEGGKVGGGTTTFKNNMGGTSTIVHGGYTEIKL